MWLLIGFVLVTMLVDLIMPAAIAKWAILAPIFIPLFLRLDVAPQTVLAAYRVGDSPFNVVTPLMAYFPLIIIFAQRYRKDAGIGTVVAMMLPYVVVLSVLWTLFFVAWYLVGIPLGPGSLGAPRLAPGLRARQRRGHPLSAGSRRMLRMIRVPIVGALLAFALLVLPPAAGADLADERALAEKYAPVVRIVEQLEVCGYGEPFVPTDIDLLLDEQTVALRGPWNRTDLVEISPSANDLVDRFEYHLDFPGDALDPGCDYNRWAQRLTEGSEPVVYAHVAGREGQGRRSSTGSSTRSTTSTTRTRATGR